MSAVEPGPSYRLIPIPGGVRVVDGVVEVLRVGPIGPHSWATVSGRVIVPDDQLEDGEQPGLVEPQVFLVRADRLGEPVRGVVAA